MNTELETIAVETQELMTEAQLLVRGFTELQLNWRRQPAEWSIGENLHHLTKTTALYVPLFEASIKGASQKKLKGEPPFGGTLTGRLLLNMLEPPVRIKVKAPDMVRPAAQHELRPTLGAFLETHQRVMDLLEEADGLPLSRLRVSSPFSSWIKLSLWQALRLPAAHGRRHLWQARQVLEAPLFPR